MVELVTDNDEGDPVTHTLLSMRVGGIEQVSLQGNSSKGLLVMMASLLYLIFFPFVSQIA